MKLKERETEPLGEHLDPAKTEARPVHKLCSCLMQNIPSNMVRKKRIGISAWEKEDVLLHWFFFLILNFYLKDSWPTLLVSVVQLGIWQLQTSWNAYHSKCSYHRSPYKVISILTALPLLYFSFPWFIIEGVYVLTPFRCFANLPTTPQPLWQPLVFCIWVYFCLVNLFWFSDSTSKWNPVVFVLL